MAEGDEGPKWWNEYLSSDALYCELKSLKAEGWKNPDADSFFKARRQRATDDNQKTKESLFRMTQAVGQRLATDTKILNLGTPTPRVLDLCMAPGGFSATVRKELPRSTIDAITLPTALGGYDVMRPRMFRNIIYADITMYCLEMGTDEGMQEKHVGSQKFDNARPYLEHPYDLVFCGGAVVKDHPIEEYRSDCEPARLTMSQLVFALNRLKHRGTLLLLLYQIESWHTVCIIHALSKFSDILVFKHDRIHAIKSSFYLVAKNVNLNHEDAKSSMSYWRDFWKYLTFKDFADIPRPISRYEEFDTDEDFRREFQVFGPRFLELARPLWKIQADALGRASFNKSHKSE